MLAPADDNSCLLFVDTCSILDLIRLVVRYERKPTDMAAASRLLTLARDRPARVELTVSSETVAELERHLHGVVEEATNALTSVWRRVSHADQVAEHLDLDGLITAADGWVDRVMARAESRTRQVLDDARVEPATDEDDRRAIVRSRLGTPPARKGSSSITDCIIIESALRVATSRRPGSTWFLTSNTKDFCDGPRRLHPRLSDEFDAAGLRFATTWSGVAGPLGDC